MNEETNNRYKKALGLFLKGTYSNYIKAQNELVNISEQASNDPNTLALLCLTHRELWPYSMKDHISSETVSKVVRRIAKIEAIGINNDICRVVENFISDRYDKAESIIDKVLLSNPGESVFYEFKSTIYEQNRDYSTALSYVDKSRSIWQNWIKPYLKAARYHMYQGNNSSAKALVESVLQNNSKHPEALVLLALLQPENGIELILSATSSDRLPPLLGSLAFSTLSKHYRDRGEKDMALKYAKQSYEMNPGEESKKLIQELSGVEVKADINQAMAKARELYKMGDYLSAQSEFRSIFQTHGNAKAALKAGESLWKMNQTKEAISWVKKIDRKGS